MHLNVKDVRFGNDFILFLQLDDPLVCSENMSFIEKKNEKSFTLITSHLFLKHSNLK